MEQKKIPTWKIVEAGKNPVLGRFSALVHNNDVFLEMETLTQKLVSIYQKKTLIYSSLDALHPI